MDSAPRDPLNFETIGPPNEPDRRPPPSAPPPAAQPPSTKPPAPPPASPAPGGNPPRPAGDIHKTEIYKGGSSTRTIRGYQLMDELGGGAYGVVYRALSPGGVEVAIKEVRYSLSRKESQRELDALELIKSLHHPYLLNLHDFWSENDRLYIAMELADSSLGQLADKHEGVGLPAAGVLPIFEEAAEALDFLHLNRVLHRDIKPANILLLRGHAKVADMGLAKSNPESVAISQNVVGTPTFMAPETLKKEFRPESDQYALALCYGELRLGRPICEGANMFEVIRWQMLGVPNLEGLAPYEEAAVRKALEKEPNLRFKSCGAFIEALRPPPLNESSSYTPPQEVGVKPRKVGWREAGFAAIAVGALLAVWIANRGKPDVPPPPPEPLVWLPPGCSPAEKAVPEPDGDRRYYSRIEWKDGDHRAVEFLLIRHEQPNDLRTFYIMKDKVTNGQFKAMWNDPEFQTDLKSWRSKYPSVKFESWRDGGWRNETENTGCDNDAHPVLRVNALEAYCFAHRINDIGGHLPSVNQWEAAGGVKRGWSVPFRNPTFQPGKDIAIGRRDGPLAVGQAAIDDSYYHCRDMAGNGQEWTRDSDDGVEFPPPRPPANLRTYQLFVVGQSYRHATPYRFGERDWSLIYGNPEIGFRVVIEPP